MSIQRIIIEHEEPETNELVLPAGADVDIPAPHGVCELPECDGKTTNMLSGLEVCTKCGHDRRE